MFCQDLLLGVITDEPAGWNSGRLEALPVRRLLDDRGFCDLVEQASQARPRLEAADLARLFDCPPQPAAAASYLLSPRSEIVDFTGLDAELTTLLDWCASGRTVDSAVVQGPGGIGKTRLAVELARRLSERRPDAEHLPQNPDIPWCAGFLSDVPEQRSEAYADFCHLVRPVLIIIDYAESRTQQVEQVLNALAAHRPPGRPVRLLLLARSTREWWERLRIRHAAATRGEIIQLVPEALYRQLTRAQVQEVAALAFNRQIAALHRAGVPDDWNPDEAAERLEEDGEIDQEWLSELPYPDHPLTVHMDALADVLLHSRQALDEKPAATAVLLEHEMKYCQRGVDAERLDVDPDLLRALVAVQSMAGAAHKDDAKGVITAAWLFYYREFEVPPPLPPDTILTLRRLLRDLYPALDEGYFGGLGPDALNAALIDELNTSSGEEFLEQVLTSPALTGSQRRRCLTILTRAAPTQDLLADSAAGVIASHPGMLKETAAVVAEQLPAAEREVWLATIENAEVELREDSALLGDLVQVAGELKPQPADSPGEPPPHEDGEAPLPSAVLPSEPTATASHASGPDDMTLPASVVSSHHGRATARRLTNEPPVPRASGGGRVVRRQWEVLHDYLEAHELQKYFLITAVPIALMTCALLVWWPGT
ncbi:hypothetical protein AN218_29380 [Streptomyces nanshensis]|uniref:Uncharacterized protein n=1 Tax=Streptomyces nanshensis TaxID=518642 RepID=A0A1E7KTZ0_9ACTN|nr:hypothetical protein AN218_29380 [Streptomyces nanshensis]